MQEDNARINQQLNQQQQQQQQAQTSKVADLISQDTVIAKENDTGQEELLVV